MASTACCPSPSLCSQVHARAGGCGARRGEHGGRGGPFGCTLSAEASRQAASAARPLPASGSRSGCVGRGAWASQVLACGPAGCHLLGTGQRAGHSAPVHCPCQCGPPLPEIPDARAQERSYDAHALSVPGLHAPLHLPAGVPIRAVACGDTHTLVVTGGGELYTFGRNQVGLGGLGGREGGGGSWTDGWPQRGGAWPLLTRSTHAHHGINHCRQRQHVLSPNTRVRAQNGQLGLGHAQDALSPTLCQGLQVGGAGIRLGGVGWRGRERACMQDGAAWVGGARHVEPVLVAALEGALFGVTRDACKPWV